MLILNNVHDRPAHVVRRGARLMGLAKANWIPNGSDMSGTFDEVDEAGSESNSTGQDLFKRLKDTFLLEYRVEDEDGDMADSSRMGEQVGHDSLELLDALKVIDLNYSKTGTNQQSVGHDVGRDDNLARRENGQTSEHGVRMDEILAEQKSGQSSEDDATMYENEKSGQPSTKARQVWEWSRYDADADAEHRPYSKAEVRAEEPRGLMTPPTEVESVWEWTRYDSEAEGEESWRVSAS